jgi:hypothetical protein
MVGSRLGWRMPAGSIVTEEQNYRLRSFISRGLVRPNKPVTGQAAGGIGNYFKRTLNRVIERRKVVGHIPIRESSDTGLSIDRNWTCARLSTSACDDAKVMASREMHSSDSRPSTWVSLNHRKAGPCFVRCYVDTTEVVSHGSTCAPAEWQRQQSGR